MRHQKSRVAIIAIVRTSRFARTFVGVFNVEGTLDLVLAISLATPRPYKATRHESIASTEASKSPKAAG